MIFRMMCDAGRVQVMLENIHGFAFTFAQTQDTSAHFAGVSLPSCQINASHRTQPRD